VDTKKLTLWPWHWCLTLLLKTITLAISFDWYVLGLIFHVCFFWQDLYMGTNRFGLVTLEFNKIFWMVCTRTLIFHTSICCDKTFPLVPTRLTFWPLSLCLTNLQKTLTLAISLELYELWYFMWVFLEKRPFLYYQQIRPCDLDLGVWPTYWKLYLWL
jgi:hypothetical protein